MEDWVAALKEYARTALRPHDGNVSVAGPTSEIEILTDRWGVPHVYARTLDDLWFGQGYLHAAERLWQIDFNRRVACGRLSEIVGEPGLALDRFFRTMGLAKVARKHAKTMDEASRAASAAYLAGFRAALATLPPPAEYQLLGLTPDFPESVGDAIIDTIAASLLISFSLSPNWPFEFLRAELAAHLGPERAREIAPMIGPEPPVAVPASASSAGGMRDMLATAYRQGVGAGLGSNNWVVAGSRTTTGAPLLANDPHLMASLPCIWMEMHLSSPELEAAGVTIPGIPGISIGHNRRIAWGQTSTQADVADLYLERLSEDGSRYLFKDKWLPVKTTREKIYVRGQNKPLVHEVRTTRHGPLIDSTIAGGTTPEVLEGRVAETIAWRWAQVDAPTSLASLLAVNTAGNWEEFRAALESWTLSSFNFVYADVDGNIGYQFTGRVPIRARGSGVYPAPGWTGEYEWTGAIPFDDLPSAFNPERGFLATANHRVVDIDYPYHITHDWEMPHRIRRIVQLITAKERLGQEDFAAMHMDTYSGIAAELVPLFLGADVSGERETDALKLIETWDVRLDTDSTAAAVFNTWFSSVAEALFQSKLGPQLYEEYWPRKAWTTNWAYDAVRDILIAPHEFWIGGDGTDNLAERDRLLGRALTDACATLEAQLGPDMSEWRWGRLHRVHFRHILGGAVPPLNDLLSIGPLEAGGGDDTLNRGAMYPKEGFADGGIASYRQIIDLGDFDRSLSVITTGNSGNPASLHFADQAPMWAAGEYHPMPFSRDAVEKAGAGRLVLRPEA